MKVCFFIKKTLKLFFSHIFKFKLIPLKTCLSAHFGTKKQDDWSKNDVLAQLFARTEHFVKHHRTQDEIDIFPKFKILTILT
jgi:hypothetical protein